MFPLIVSCQTIRTFSYGFKMPSLTLGNTLITSTGVQLNYLNTATSNIQTQLNAKQATLVSGTTLKTVGGTTLLGSGDISVSGTGSVTTVSVTTANGISGTVATATSTPAITLTLGAITPTSVNGVVFSGSSTPTLNVIGTTSITGANTGDNAVNSLYSGLVSNATHTGDVTGATTLTIANGVVTLAKMANMATSSLIYRKTAGTGVPEVNTLATLKTDLGLTGTNSGDQTSVTGNAGTATALQNARLINTVSFNGTANISVPSNITPGTVGNLMTSTGSVWSSVTPADTVSLGSVAMLKHPTITPETNSYGLQVADDGTIITMNSSGATNLTIPLNATQPIPVGATITFFNIGSGTMTFVITGGVTAYYIGLNLVANKGASATKLATNTWVIVGGLN